MTSRSSTSSAHDEVQRHDEMPLMESEEASEVLQELRRMEDEDPDGFYDYKVGADGRLEGIFWASSALGWDYVTYGGVVVVDTTFRTNRCGAPFVPFLGLNHHRRPIVFGCGVVADQSVDSFVWLLRAFMQSIQDDVPKSIITDGGDAVVAAVKAVFPQSNHRVCTSHVEQAIREHLLHGSAQDDFRSLMRDACSPAAFDERWSGFLAKHRTAENEGWLATMHRRRELWAAAFTRHKFFLGMASDQRTECLATGLHTGLADDMSLLDLFWHTDDWTYRMREDGAELDLAVSMSRLPLTTKHRYLEANAARRFTPANFYLLRQEIEKMDGFVVVDTLPTISSPDEKIYLLDSKQERCGGGAPFVVQWCTNRPGVDGKLAVTCSCKKMESEGLPCRHILRVMSHRGVSQIPECFVLDRQRRIRGAKFERMEEMKELSTKVFDLASEDAREFEEVKRFMESFLKERRAWLDAACELERGGHADADAEGASPSTKKIKLSDE